MQRRAVLFLLACIPFFTACAIIPIARPASPPASKPASASVTVKRAQFLMGTLVEITAVAPSDAIAQASLTAGFQEIRRLEKDRKSTRLNSSHGYISYAVFCLKKKKKKKNKTQ